MSYILQNGLLITQTVSKTALIEKKKQTKKKKNQTLKKRKKTERDRH